jgi:ABC-type cobalamin/Fe3+-siderophores transport system ATPase subunit
MRFPHMPRYFFHLFNGADDLDEDGRELADRQAAIEQAFSLARQLIARDVVASGRIPFHHRIKVTDASGSVVFTLRFSGAVTLSQ